MEKRALCTLLSVGRSAGHGCPPRLDGALRASARGRRGGWHEMGTSSCHCSDTMLRTKPSGSPPPFSRCRLCSAGQVWVACVQLGSEAWSCGSRGDASPPRRLRALSLRVLVRFRTCEVTPVSSGCSHGFSCLAFSYLLCFYVSPVVGKSFPDNTNFHLQRNPLLPDLLPSPQEHL